MQARRLGAVAFSQDEPSDAPLHEGQLLSRVLDLT